MLKQFIFLKKRLTSARYMGYLVHFPASSPKNKKTLALKNFIFIFSKKSFLIFWDRYLAKRRFSHMTYTPGWVLTKSKVKISSYIFPPKKDFLQPGQMLTKGKILIPWDDCWLSIKYNISHNAGWLLIVCLLNFLNSGEKYINLP